MQQVLFEIGGFKIYGYGVMLVLGFFAALQLAKFLARRSGIDGELFVNAGLIALLTGVAGARISHVLENLPTYTDPHRTAWENFMAAVNLRSGGLTFYGGLIFATFCTIGYGILKKIPIRHGMDIVAPCVLVGLALGRVGCFLNGCCEGAVCEPGTPFATYFPYDSNPYQNQYARGQLTPPRELLGTTADGRTALLPTEEVQRLPDGPQLLKNNKSLPVHPAQLYSTFTALLVAAVLVAYFTLPHIHGRVFALMLLIESPTRFILEMIRSEPAVIGYGSGKLTFLPAMSFSMVVSAVLFLIGIVLWIAFGKINPTRYEPKAKEIAPTIATPAAA